MTRSRDVATQGGLVLLNTTTIGTAVSSIVVSNAFSATYDNYLVQISGSNSNGSGEVKLKLGASTTGYYYSAYFPQYASGALNILGNNTSSFVAGSGLNNGGVNVSANIMNPFLARFTFIQGPYTFTDGSAALSGYHSPTTSYTDFTITTTGFSLTGGTLKVYGYK